MTVLRTDKKLEADLHREIREMCNQIRPRGWASAPDGPYAWGYCKKKEEGVQGKNFCHPDANWPCVPGRKYYGRGPMQITYNYNYGPAGRAIHEDLLSHPGLVDTDPVISFKTAIWFWMTPQEPKPSCHDVITNKWRPSPADRAAGRAPGFGVITNIINGGVECGKGTSTDAAKDRVGFYKSNYNYGPAGRAIHEDLLSHPGLVDTDPVISFKTAIWFWMTPQEPKPSCHDVITNKWRPSPADRAAGRAPGFGVITNIINGGKECGRGTSTEAAKDRVGFYKRYCGMLGVDPGPNLPCRDQKPFG
ncbi:hypothetical protein COCNU_07G014740 [Cocos nucifera]|uniref:chitinase n=1 Tax=Cocos nucifera TaxID=13894 RepID=A0A8K0IGT4_COCNU|nr:hypothetical protein COCNU_07G014740 [Cocos nucifera]